MAKGPTRRQGGGKRRGKLGDTTAEVSAINRKRVIAAGGLLSRPTQVHGPQKGDRSDRRDGQRQCRKDW